MASATERCCLTVLEAGDQGVCFLLRPFSLPGRRRPSHCILLSSLLITCTLLASLLIRAPVLDQGPTLMTSFNLNYLLQSPIFKYSLPRAEASAQESGQLGEHNWARNRQHRALGFVTADIAGSLLQSLQRPRLCPQNLSWRCRHNIYIK